MGNWRTVNIIGTVAKTEVDKLKEACTYNRADYSNFHCLSMSDGLCGLGNWVNTIINARGNLAERNYTVNSIAQQLRQFVKVAPSLKIKVHCGGDYESEEVVATITVENGKVIVGSPEIACLMGASEDEITGRLLKQLQGL
jgi:hypothetical protein